MYSELHVIAGAERDRLQKFPTGALNMATGETVAVKEIQLSNIPKAELPEIQVALSSHYREIITERTIAYVSQRLIC